MSLRSAKQPSRDVLKNVRIEEQQVAVPAKPESLPKATATTASKTKTEDDVPFLGTDDSPPRFEAWLGVSLLTFVPGSLVFVLPHEILTRALVPICVSMAVCFFVGFGMLMRDRRFRQRAAA
jgi:hypothetical protein